MPRGPTPISAAQRATLTRVPFVEDDMRHYLLRVAKRSVENANHTLKVVRLLDGAGQQHPKARGRFFAGGVDAFGSRINMEQDFVALRDLANAWLPLHRDQSHGWTCNHAINRLIDYQRFLYEQRGPPMNVPTEGDGDVVFQGIRTRDERDKAGRAAAVDLVSSDEEEDDEPPTTSAAAWRKRRASASGGDDAATPTTKKPTRRSIFLDDPVQGAATVAGAPSGSSAREAQCVFELQCDPSEYRVSHQGGVLRVFFLKRQ